MEADKLTEKEMKAEKKLVGTNLRNIKRKENRENAKDETGRNRCTTRTPPPVPERATTQPREDQFSTS